MKGVRTIHSVRGHDGQPIIVIEGGLFKGRKEGRKDGRKEGKGRK